MRTVALPVLTVAAAAALLAGCVQQSSTGTPSSSPAGATVSSSSAPSSSAAAPTTSAGSAATTTSASPAGSTAASPQAAVTSVAQVPKVDETKKLNVAFFGFAKANSFAEATWGGVQKYVAGHNATATFIDSNFDAGVQASAMQDATTSHRYQVYVVQPYDGSVMVAPVKQAIAAGITVVIEFGPLGSRYDTFQPQVPGTITLIDTPVGNGQVLGKLGVGACASKKLSPCKVAYLEGFANLPLDAARTKAVESTLKAAPGVDLVSAVVGGYTPDSGRSAMQDVLQAHPDVNVVIGSSQAIEGASALPNTSSVLWIGNGGSTQAVNAVKAGKWFAAYVDPENTAGQLATALGLAKARGATVPMANNERLLSPGGGLGTKAVLADVTGQYSD